MDNQNQPDNHPEQPENKPEEPVEKPDERPPSTIPGRNKISRVAILTEAFTIRAATRKAPSPPKAMPVTPTLPKVPKPARDRKKAAKEARYRDQAPNRDRDRGR